MKKLLPVYCLVGEDGYRQREFFSDLKRRLLSGDDNSLNYEYFPPGEADPARVLDAARTPAWDLFSAGTGVGRSARLVVVDGAESFSAEQWRKLKDYFDDPDPASCLVFLVNKPQKEWKGKKYLPGKYLVNFSPLRKDKLSAWINREASRRGLTLSRGQVEQCALAAGNDLGALAGGLERLAIYQGGKGRVTDQAVRDLVGVGEEGSVFDLTEMAAGRRAGEALAILNRLLDEGEAPLRIFALVTGSVRKLWLGVDAWERTKDPQTVLEAAGVRYYREQFLRQVKKLSSPRIAFWYRRLVETDWALKGGEKDPRLALERLLIDLAEAG
ncbi:MAG: DNA polymerase III subunit delta [Candidatus Erginobacter occultus]|nr:DNA polymerase III subunit delta [Candidatus Erginobacter occultus]